MWLTLEMQKGAKVQETDGPTTAAVDNVDETDAETALLFDLGEVINLGMGSGLAGGLEEKGGCEIGWTLCTCGATAILATLAAIATARAAAALKGRWEAGIVLVGDAFNAVATHEVVLVGTGDGVPLVGLNPAKDVFVAVVSMDVVLCG